MKYTPLDIETTGLDFNRGKILGIGVQDIFIRNTDIGLVRQPMTTQNGKFEYKWLRKNGIHFDYAFDTMLSASVLIDRPDSLSLDSLAAHYLGIQSWKDDTNKMFKKKNWAEKLQADPIMFQALEDRNIKDLEVTGKLTEVLEQKLEQEGMTEFFHEKLMPAARMLAETEYRGICLDVPATKQKLTQIEEKIGQLLTQLNEWAGTPINWNSPKQLSVLLKQKGYNLWIYDYKKRQMVESTGEESLERLLPNPNIALLLDYRGAVKLKGYLEGWLEDQFEGRIHCNFNLASTRTGRLSSSSPNLQQIPRDKEIRSLFIASPGKVFIVADLAQVEPRIAAHYSQDAALTEVFTNGLDFYGSIANKVLDIDCHPNKLKELYPKERQVAKEIGLSILYGIGKDKLSSIIKKRTGILIDPKDCAKIINDYFKGYPALLMFRQYVMRKIERGEILQTYYGRQFKLDPNKAFSTGVNTIIQSTASDLCLFSQLEIDKKLKELNIEAPLIAIVHDEVIRECAPEHVETVGALIESTMCRNNFKCPIKLEWKSGPNWGCKS